MSAHLIAAKTDEHLKNWEPETIPTRCECCALYWSCLEAGETLEGCNQWREVLTEGIE